MAGWQSGTLTGIGLENMRITRSTASDMFIGLLAVADSWLTGLAIAPNPNINGNYVIGTVDSRNLTIRNNWIDPGGGANQGGSTFATYGISLVETSQSLVENNITNGLYAPIVMNGASSGNVVAYNYEHFLGAGEGYSFHEEGEQMNLYEGNSFTKVQADIFHGNSNFNTMFRNHAFGGDTGFDIWAYHRWWNIIGNVIQSTVYKSIYSDGTKYSRWDGAAIRLGYASQNASGGSESGFTGTVVPDPLVATSTMLWGNYATAGASARWLASEVPATDPLFPNAVPGNQTLPASLYLSARPNWWPQSKPWPAIGPDVTGGNVPGYAGHVYTTPPEDCFTNSADLANFNPNSCYGTGAPDATAPSVPTGLSATAGSSSQINLSWTASTDNLGVAGYKIFRNGTQIGTSPTSSFQDTGLSSSTTYSYTVSAYDFSNNNSAQSGSASATTATPAAPPVVTNITASSITTTSAVVTWTTNVAADSQVEYGLSTAYGSQTTVDTNLSTSHSQALSGLLSGTIYNFRVKSRESSGSLTTSANFSFTTTLPTPGTSLVYMKFDESGGAVTALDSSGNAINGTVLGGATFAAGHVGNAISLDGSTTQSVDLGNPATLQLTGSMTISAWIKSGAFPFDDAAIVSKRAGGSQGYQLDTTVDTGPRTIGFKLTNSSGGLMTRYGASTLAINSWYYVTGVYDATAQTLNVYLNGTLDNGTLTGTITGSQQNTALDVFVGKRAGARLRIQWNGGRAQNLRSCFDARRDPGRHECFGPNQCRAHYNDATIESNGERRPDSNLFGCC